MTCPPSRACCCKARVSTSSTARNATAIGVRAPGPRARHGRPWAFPPLAGNRAVTQASPVNLVRWVLDGGYGPTTAAHPRPWGMPPFRSQLTDEEIAAVASHVRQAWGNNAGGVSALQVQQLR